MGWACHLSDRQAALGTAPGFLQSTHHLVASTCLFEHPGSAYLTSSANRCGGSRPGCQCYSSGCSNHVFRAQHGDELGFRALQAHCFGCPQASDASPVGLGLGCPACCSSYFGSVATPPGRYEMPLRAYWVREGFSRWHPTCHMR